MATYKVDALILKKRKYQEADRIVTLFGRGTGKETVRARGVRKIKSKLAGHLETFSHSDLLIAEGKGFDIITQAVTRESFGALRNDFPKTAEAFYAFELLDKVTPEGYKDSSLFDFILRYLRAINDARHENLRLLRHAMEIQLLENLGFVPQFQICANCNKKFDPKTDTEIFFHSQSGDFFHAEHNALGNTLTGISFDTLKVLQFLLKNTFEQIQKLSAPANIAPELESVLVHLVHDVSEKKIHSKKLLR